MRYRQKFKGYLYALL